MSLYLILTIITVFLALAATSSSAVSAIQKLGTGFIIIGPLLVSFLAFYIWLFASSTICGGALLNGQNNKKFNKSHHQIRFCH